jgi:hypothetical protein
LKRLREHDVVERVGRGLYELPDDRARATTDEIDAAPTHTEPEPRGERRRV